MKLLHICAFVKDCWLLEETTLAVEELAIVSLKFQLLMRCQWSLKVFLVLGGDVLRRREMKISCLLFFLKALKSADYDEKKSSGRQPHQNEEDKVYSFDLF